ncbi:hypothetical protein M9Y10_028881 [Tritrichomonas musculus]|uniref:Translin-associated factor X-interacting protein 1 N-terminal domain-containing protein n=1 Tax=Tritrichomonas musculus TaxID=1915356 RepID=A0ABR2KLG5_9EUKA
MNNDENPKTEPATRPSTVKFNVDYDYQLHQKTRPTTSIASRNPLSGLTSPSSALKGQMKKKIKTKTADVSHITDQRQKPLANIPSFIPDEFRKEVTTPTPLKPGTGSLNVNERTWHTQIFPTEAGVSRDEVTMLEEWLNQVLEKNLEESGNDFLTLAANARRWFGITYDELCRQVNSECPERAQLMSSIWKRYQELFQRVAQLHEEERSYLISCHKQRTTQLKNELDKTQSRLRVISQQYKDDQERWSNAREREETKFANMRKKLDLQVKNKRNLMLKIKSLKEKIEQKSDLDDGSPKNGNADEELKKNEIETSLTQSENKDAEKNKAEQIQLIPTQVSDRVQTLRQRIRNDYNYMIQISAPLDDIAHFIDKDREPPKLIRELYPHLIKSLPISHSGHMRTTNWLMSALTYFYAYRLTDLCDKRYAYQYPTDRLHFVNSIYSLFLRSFGTPYQASEVFFDLILTSRKLSEKEDNQRAKIFLKFIDCGDEYLDSVYLDFYCFLIGTYLSSITEKVPMFPDVFTEEKTSIAQISHLSAVEFSKKVFYAICEGDIAEDYISKMIEKFDLKPKDQDIKISLDLIIDFMIDSYKLEEKRVAEQLREQYEMDAAQYGGIVTLGQFQTLAMFSPRKINNREYTEMMSETFLRSSNKTISFNALIDELHKRAMLVPFIYDRIDYSIDAHPTDMIGFMKNEYLFHKDDYETKLDKISKSDDNLYQNLLDIKSKFEQVLELNRTGLFTEIAQREYYEKFSTVNIEL